MTAPQQPPAGWYPDPQDASQQRYWDGNAWTGHTAAQGAAAAPVGDAAAGTPVPAAAAPAWSVPPGGMMGAPTGKKPWFKRTWVIVTGVVIVALIVVGAIFGKGGNHSNGLDKAIKAQSQTQFQALYNESHPGSTVTVTKVNCVEAGSSQQYSCLIYLTVTDASGQATNYMSNGEATCDNHTYANCVWHAGVPTPTAG